MTLQEQQAGWEKDLRLKVIFDSNQDLEVCVLFIQNLIARTRQETLDAVEAGMPVEADEKVALEPLMGFGYNTCRAAMIAHLKTLREL